MLKKNNKLRQLKPMIARMGLNLNSKKQRRRNKIKNISER
tara:strand:+ start:175 stop:294 length:120 start_codon:yes stop_codon:yes gene_type:complete